MNCIQFVVKQFNLNSALNSDDRISFHSTDLGTPPELFDLHHYQAGGVIDANVASNGNILSVSEDGTLVLFQRKEPIEVNQEVDKHMVSNMQKLKGGDVDKVDDEGVISWSERKNFELKENERKKFEKEINAITETVESMSEQVAR